MSGPRLHTERLSGLRGGGCSHWGAGEGVPVSVKPGVGCHGPAYGEHLPTSRAGPVGCPGLRDKFPP